MINERSNNEILKELDKLVYGHTEAKKSLIALVNRSKMRYTRKWGDLVDTSTLPPPGRCLLIGGSGTGKTHIIQSLSRIVKFPFLTVDASRFNHTGASGGIKPEDLEKLIERKAYECASVDGYAYHSMDGVLDQMVVFIDEFDKISAHYDGSSGGNWNASTQAHFLTMLENIGKFSGVSFVLAGAFSGIGKTTEVVSNPIGFNGSKPSKKKVITEVTDEDVISYGMLPEIVGRMSSICMLDTLEVKDYMNILKTIILPGKLNELSYYGLSNSKIPVKKQKEIATEASKSSQGVRYMKRALDKYFMDLEFNYESSGGKK